MLRLITAAPLPPHPTTSVQIIATEPSLPEFALLRLNTARLPNVYAEYGAVWDRHALQKVRTVPARARHPHNTPCLLAGIRPVYVTVVPLKPPHSSAYPLFLPAAGPAGKALRWQRHGPRCRSSRQQAEQHFLLR